MDQVKVVLAVIKKHHFWVLCGVIVVVALGAWWSATSGLAKSIEERKGVLESAKSSVEGVTSDSLHANQQCIEAIEAKHEDLKNEVLKAWSFFYEEQRKNNQWPPVDPTFRRDISLLGPDDEIPVKHRDSYMYFIRRHLPQTFEIADLRLPVQKDEMGMPIVDEETGEPVKINPFENPKGMQGSYGGPSAYDGGAMEDPGSINRGGSAGDEKVGKVEWAMNDLKRIYAGYYWKTRPTTAQVRLAQEDLWVYEALLRIIAKTNETSTSHYNAAVKTIQALEIGQKAAAAFAQSRAVRTTGMGGGMGGEGMEGTEGMEGPMPADMGAMGGPGMGGMPGMGMPGMGMDGTSMEGEMASTDMGGPGGPRSSAGSHEEQIKMQWMNYRYVDQNRMPLPADRAINDPPFAEFKMMPVRMLLIVDQRRIDSLLVNCANSAMPVVVCQVGLNPGKGTSLNLGGGADMAGGGFGMPGGAFGGPRGGPGMMPGAGSEGMYDAGMGGPMGSGTSMGMGMGGGPNRRDQQMTYDMPIEVQGIIYIFNPPDKEKLGTGSAGEEPSTPPAGQTVVPPVAAPGLPSGGAPATPPAKAPGVPPAGAPGVAPGTGTPATPPGATPGMPPAGEPAAAPAAAAPMGAPAAPTAPAKPPATEQGNP